MNQVSTMSHTMNALYERFESDVISRELALKFPMKSYDLTTSSVFLNRKSQKQI